MRNIQHIKCTNQRENVAKSLKFCTLVRLVAAAVTAASSGGGCRDAGGLSGAAASAGGGGVAVPVVTLDYDTCSTPRACNSDGPARPLGYPRETPTGGEPAGPSTPSPPWKEDLPAEEGWMGTDTGPADSIAIDSGAPPAATLSLTEEREGEEVAATGATSLGSTSLYSVSLCSFVLGCCALGRV